MTSLIYAYSKPSSLLWKLYRERDRLLEAIKSQNDEQMADVFFNFVVTAYHIRDWVLHHPESNVIASELNSYCQYNVYIQACRDISNSSKHFIITQYTPTTKGVEEVISHIDKAVLNGDFVDIYGKTDIQITLADGSEMYTAEFAMKTIEAWCEFFQSRNIST